MALRLLGGGALPLAAGGALGARPASAGRTWCRCDPTVRVDGQVVHLYVSGLLDQTYDVSGSTEVVVRVPPKVSYALLEQDAGFGQGYATSFAADAKLKVTTNQLDVAADVYVPDGTVEVAARNEGTTNAWIGAATKVKRGT